jgi:SpoVK/Ycf46/Vps4 family AAA+-type ATPase
MMPLRCGIENLSITQIQERAQALKEACQLPITMENFNIAISKISSSISKEMLEKDEKWIKDFVFD